MSSKSNSGNRIRERRQVLGLSQEQLAEAIGTNQAQMSRYELNTNMPGSDALVKLARTLNVSSDYLLGLTNTAERHTDTVADLDELERAAIEAIRAVSAGKRESMIDVIRGISRLALDD